MFFSHHRERATQSESTVHVKLLGIRVCRNFGDYGLQTLDRGWIKNNQIEACRVTINRYLKRKGKVWIRIFPHKPTTSRPPETRMGKGKGAPEHWVAVVRPGLMLFEVSGVSEAMARDALRRAANKLGVNCRFVSRDSH